MAFQHDSRRSDAPDRTPAPCEPRYGGDDRLRGWYVARYAAGRSALAEAQLHRRADIAARAAVPDRLEMGLRHVPRSAAPAAVALLRAGVQIFVPLRIERQWAEAPRASRIGRSAMHGRRSGPRWIRRQAPAFPGYLFFRAPDDTLLGRVCQLAHVEAVLRGASEGPMEVPPVVMATLLSGPMECADERPASRLRTGTRVRITEGAFTGLPGTLQDVGPSGSLTILMDILGGQRPVSVSGDVVEAQDQPGRPTRPLTT